MTRDLCCSYQTLLSGCGCITNPGSCLCLLRCLPVSPTVLLCTRQGPETGYQACPLCIAGWHTLEGLLHMHKAVLMVPFIVLKLCLCFVFFGWGGAALVAVSGRHHVLCLALEVVLSCLLPCYPRNASSTYRWTRRNHAVHHPP
jgi:hypothetical protein